MKMTPAFCVRALLALAPSIVHAAEDDALQLVEVVGRRSGGAYHAQEASGSKTDLALRELPQAVRVMSRQSLDDLGAVRVDDALDFVGGVSRQNNFGGMWDNVAIRGLAGDMNNGMGLLQNGFAANRGFNAPRDTANIERIEFLKGAAASLYGASEPGGTLNIVTKSPLWRAGHAVEAYAGSYDFYRAAVDSTGPIGTDLAYRFNGAVEKRGSFRDHIRSRRALIAPAFTWKIAPGTTLEYRGEALRHEAPLDRGVVGIGVMPREHFLGEPADGDMRVQNLSQQLVLEHRLGEQWSLRGALSHKDATLRGFSTEGQPKLQGDGRTLQRQRRYRDYASDDLAAQLELSGRLQTAGVVHQLLIGAEAYRLDFDMRVLRANPGPANPYAIDILAPSYGQTQPQPLPSSDTYEEQRNRALYVQDAMSIGNWRVVAGVRVDDYRQSLRNRIKGALTMQDPTASSPRLGVSYLPSAQWTLFANAGRSFRPNSGVSFDGQAFAPERGRALEAGAKWESQDHKQGATLALYDIRKRDVVTSDPNPRHAGFSVTAGQVRSRGLDFDYSGQLAPNWRANTSVSLIDAEVREDNTLEKNGRLLNIPRVNASMLLVYEQRGSFSLGGGVSYSGRRLGQARTQDEADKGIAAFDLPGYALGKLVAYWHLSRNVRVSLDIDNLFDRTYYSSSFQRTWVTPGMARSATIGVQARF